MKEIVDLFLLSAVAKIVLSILFAMIMSAISRLTFIRKSFNEEITKVVIN